MKRKTPKAQNPPHRRRKPSPALPPYEQWIQNFGENRRIRKEEIAAAVLLMESEGGIILPERQVNLAKFGYAKVTTSEMRDCPGDWLFADGGCIGTNPSPHGVPWAWIRIKDGEIADRQSGVLTPQRTGTATVSNNISELYAVIHGLQHLPDGWQGTIVSDSHVTLCRRFPSAKMNGVPPRFIDYARHWFCSYLSVCRWVLVDGHPTKAQLAEGAGKRGGPVSKWNVECDTECYRLAREWKEANLKPAPAEKVEVL